MDRITLDIVRSVAELEKLRGFWTARHTSRDGDLDHYLFTLASWPEIERPHVIVVQRNGRPENLLIGRIQDMRLPLRLGYVRVPSARVRLLAFIEGGTMRDLDEEAAELVSDSLLASLRAGEADGVLLDGVRLDHPLYRQALAKPGFLTADRCPAARTHWTRTLDPGGKGFLASLPKSERHSLRRRTRRLLEDFPDKVRIERFAVEADIDRLIRDSEAVAQTSYQRALGVGFVADERMRERLALEARSGALRGHVLYIDGKPASYSIASYYKGVCYRDYMGYDPAYAKYAPGLYLLVNEVDELLAETKGKAPPLIDFGHGEAEWKAQVGNASWQEASLYIWAPTAKGVATNALRTFATVTDQAAKGILQRTGFLPRLKRLWRNRIAPPAREQASAEA